MKSTIDTAGRLVVPKRIREQAGLRPGEPIEIIFRDGRIEIETAPREIHIEERDGFMVAEPIGPYEILEEDTVRKTREQTRTGRKPR